jgi:hypothetical protein
VGGDIRGRAHRPGVVSRSVALPVRRWGAIGVLVGELLDVRYFAGHRLCRAVSRERNVPERTAPYGCVPEGVQAASAVEKAMGVLIITNPGLEFVWVRSVPLSASSSARDWPSRS